jgi:MFS family permease
MGTVLGAMTMTSSIGMAAGPVAGGWLYETYGTYHWLYIASAAIGIAAAALALAFPPAKKDVDETTTELQPA